MRKAEHDQVATRAGPASRPDSIVDLKRRFEHIVWVSLFAFHEPIRITTMNRLLALTLALGLAPTATFAAEPIRKSEQCWQGSFTEQLSGPVRELSSSGRGSGYTSSYDGDFKWKGEPARQAVTSTYVFCFTDRLDDGGALIANGKRIELDRIGSIRRPPVAQESAFRSSVSIRDVREFPRLYGIFSTPGKPSTSLEIQLEPLREKVLVVSSARDQAGHRIVSVLEGPATRVAP